MELIRVNETEINNILDATLKTLVADDEIQDIREGIIETINGGSTLYSLNNNSDMLGFLVITPLTEEEDEEEQKSEIISVNDIWIREELQDRHIAETICTSLKQIALDEFNTKRIELIIDRSMMWMSEIIAENGFYCQELQFEKILPNPGNLPDVIELILDCTPEDRIIMVVMEKEEEFSSEIIESAEEVDEYMADGWTPVMVSVTIEPTDMTVIPKIIETSDQLLNWDDFEMLYYR